MEAVLFPIAALIFFLFFTEIVTFNVVYEDELIVDLDFLILGIRFYPQRTKNKNEKKSDRNKKKRKKNTSDLLKTVSRIIPSAEVMLNHLYINVHQENYATGFIAKGVSAGIINAFLKLIELKAKKFTAENIIIDTFDNNNSKFILDVRVSIPFYVFSRYILHIVKDIKLQREDKGKNVGRKNERNNKILPGRN